MPGDVTQVLSIGFCGKLPARSDFVRWNLPRGFVDAWDNWLAEVLAATKREAGDDWLPAFLEAPVWRFLLPAGMCGACAVTGLLMPSVDRVGRYFPLTFAAVARRRGFLRNGAADVWLNRCEDLGRAALQDGLSPDLITDMLSVPELSLPELEFTDAPVATAEWWTDGSPRVKGCAMTLDSLPGSAVFGRILGVTPKNGSSRSDECA